MTSGGVAAGAPRQNHDDEITCGKPASGNVGVSGICGARCSLATASASSLPDLMCSSSGEMFLNHNPAAPRQQAKKGRAAAAIRHLNDIDLCMVPEQLRDEMNDRAGARMRDRELPGFAPCPRQQLLQRADAER